MDYTVHMLIYDLQQWSNCSKNIFFNIDKLILPTTVKQVKYKLILFTKMELLTDPRQFLYRIG